MPNPALQDAIKEAYSVAPTNMIIHHTLEFYHPSFDDQVIRVVEGFGELVATLESGAPRNEGEQVTFQPYPFRVTLPPVFEKAAPELSIAIDNVSREILVQIEKAATSLDSIELIYRPYVNTDLSTPQMNPPIKLNVVGCTANISTITATCRFHDLANVSFPTNVYTSREFPGLIR